MTAPCAKQSSPARSSHGEVGPFGAGSRLFDRFDDPHRLVFAFGGALAHVNATIRSERLRIAGTAQGLALEAA